MLYEVITSMEDGEEHQETVDPSAVQDALEKLTNRLRGRSQVPSPAPFPSELVPKIRMNKIRPGITTRVLQR